MYGAVGLVIVVGIILAVLGGMGYFNKKSGGSPFSISGSTSGSVAPGGFNIPGSVQIIGFDPNTGLLTFTTDSAICQDCLINVELQATICPVHEGGCRSGGNNISEKLSATNIDPTTHQGTLQTGNVIEQYPIAHYGTIQFTAHIMNTVSQTSGPSSSWSYTMVAPN